MTSYQQLREGLDGASGSADVDTSEPTEDEIKVQVLAKQAYRGQDDELALTFHKGDVLTLLPRRPCASAGMGIAWYQVQQIPNLTRQIQAVTALE